MIAGRIVEIDRGLPGRPELQRAVHRHALRRQPPLPFRQIARRHGEGVVRMAERRRGLPDLLQEEVDPRRAAEIDRKMVRALAAVGRRRPAELLQGGIVDGHEQRAAQHVAIEAPRHREILHRYGEMLDAAQPRPAERAQQPPRAHRPDPRPEAETDQSIAKRRPHDSLILLVD